MNCKDYMVGDLVYIHEPECKGHRIDSIDELDGQVGADGEVYDECDIRPIPLTEEILVKNGFEVHPFGCVWYQEKGIDFQNYIVVYFRRNGEPRKVELCFVNKVSAEVRNINYVHQLQHLLRLCGIEKELVI